MAENPGVQRTSPIRIVILAFDGCMASAVVGMLDALHIANVCNRRCNGTQNDAFAPAVLAACAGQVQASSGFGIPATALDAAEEPVHADPHLLVISPT